MDEDGDGICDRTHDGTMDSMLVSDVCNGVCIHRAALP